MTQQAMLPCFVCGKTLLNVDDQSENQPSGGTEFRTYGHYGSTFWDSLDGEELALNVCDDCLSLHKERLAQQKRYLPIVTNRRLLVGKQWVDRPMVSYSGNPDDGSIIVEPEELGTKLGSHVEWPENIEEIKRWVQEMDA